MTMMRVAAGEVESLFAQRREAERERDEWRSLARRLARVIETQRRYSMCGTRYHLYKQYKADYLAAEADVSAADLALATAPEGEAQ